MKLTSEIEKPISEQHHPQPGAYWSLEELVQNQDQDGKVEAHSWSTRSVKLRLYPQSGTHCKRIEL